MCSAQGLDGFSTRHVHDRNSVKVIQRKMGVQVHDQSRSNKEQVHTVRKQSNHNTMATVAEKGEKQKPKQKHVVLCCQYCGKYAH